MTHCQSKPYTPETLRPLNTLYDAEHTLTPEDVDAANAFVRHIEISRCGSRPKIGDRVHYTTRHGDFYGDALIEAVRKDRTLSICLCPYVSFVWATADGVGCSVSGGPFTDVLPHDLKAVGTTSGSFKDWGHCRYCANGAFSFEAEVRLWEYQEADPLYGDFTTKEWRKLDLHKYASRMDDDLYRGKCVSFGSEEEFRRFLSDYDGTMFPAPNSQSVVVWCYRDEQVALSRAEWNALDAPVSQRRIYNVPQPVKLIKDHGRHSTVCYFVGPEFIIQ